MVSWEVKLNMGNRILNSDREILYLSNSAFEILQRKLEDILEDENIKDINITNFVEKMDQRIYGGGVIYLDINEYFKYNLGSLLLFIKIINIALNQLTEEKLFNISRKEETYKFIRELENYYKSLSGS